MREHTYIETGYQARLMMTQQVYKIGNMDCANCARELQEGVARLDGVETVEVSFATGKMRLSGDVSYEALKTRVEAMGKTITHMGPAGMGQTTKLVNQILVVGTVSAVAEALVFAAARASRSEQSPSALSSSSVVVTVMLAADAGAASRATDPVVSRAEAATMVARRA